MAASSPAAVESINTFLNIYSDVQSGSLPGYPGFAGYAHLAFAAAVSRIVFVSRNVHPLFALLLVFAVFKRDRARGTPLYTGTAHDAVVVHSCIRSLVRVYLRVRYDASVPARDTFSGN